MKKIIITIITLILLVAPLLGVLPRNVHAAAGAPSATSAPTTGTTDSGNAPSDNSFAGRIANAAKTSFLSSIQIIVLNGIEAIAYVVLYIASGFLYIMGMLLNASILLTLNISALVNKVTAINTAWVTIRDFSSVFIIFLLLYTSISMILGVKGHSFADLVKKIVFAGVLINFSLFFTKVAIDASNVISLSLYTAMIPGVNTNIDPSNPAYLSKIFKEPGISNVFMQGLAPQTVYKPLDSAKDAFNIALQTIVTGIGGAVIMFTTGFSFLFASVAFLARLCVLIMLLAFSPIYFVASIFPQVKSQSERWLDLLKSMCLFMPAYLFFMYVAVTIVSSNVFHVQIPSSTDASGQGLIGAGTIGLVLNYVIAMFFINAPLVAALAVGGSLTKSISKWTDGVKKWTKANSFLTVDGARDTAKGFAGFTAQHIIGRRAKAIGESETVKNFAKDNPFWGGVAYSVIDKGSKASFGGSKGGYDKRFDNYATKKAGLAKKLDVGKDSKAVQEQIKGFGGATKKMAEEADIKAEEQKMFQKIIDLSETNNKLKPEEKSQIKERNTRLIAESKSIEKKLRKEVLNRTNMTEEEVAEAATKEVNKARIEEYAKNLEKEAKVFRMTEDARKKAAKTIRKDQNKTKDDKLADEFKEIIKKANEADKKDDGGKGGDKGGK